MDTPTRIYGEDLPDFVEEMIGDSRPVWFEGGPTLKVSYREDGVGALARLNLCPIRSDPGVWRAVLHWGPRGARHHHKFQVIGLISWVIQPGVYMQGKARRK